MKEIQSFLPKIVVCNQEQAYKNLKNQLVNHGFMVLESKHNIEKKDFSKPMMVEMFYNLKIMACSMVLDSGSHDLPSDYCMFIDKM